MHDNELHCHLIGADDARDRFNTPVLCIDLDALDRNIAAMARFARASGVRLRPHAKTHKCVAIALRQIAAGAIGQCCAKLGEAEVLAAGGVHDLLITSPVVSVPAIERLSTLCRSIRRLAVVVDHPDNVEALDAAMNGTTLDVFIDIDPGSRRTGVTSAAAALEVSGHIQRASNLKFAGVQFYCGPQQHIASFAARRAAIVDRIDYLKQVLAAFNARGIHVPVITGAGTGTHRIDADLGVFTEWQVGSYAFMDREYADCELTPEPATAFEHALFVEARVISANTRGVATVDAGLKAFACDAGSPTIASGAPPGTKYRFMGDEHGMIVDPEGSHEWRLGDLVRFVVPHCDPTVNLYDTYHVLRGARLEAIWSIDGRGRSR